MPRIPSFPPDRFWTGPDGREWRVWLEEPPLHLRRLGQTDLVLTFVPMGWKGYDVVRRVPVGTDLLGMTEDELERLLAME